MQKSSVCFMIILIACLTHSVRAQEKNTEHTFKLGKQAPGKATLDQISWLAGSWEGTGLGGECDEHWTSAKNGSMVGAFRLHMDKKLAFSEYMTIQSMDGTLIARVKHFNPDFTGWEAKDKSVDFKLIKIEGKTAYFEGLTYTIGEDGKLNVYVAMKSKDGLKEGHFVMTNRYTK